MRSIEKIKKDIAQTKLEIQRRKDVSANWRIGKDIYDPALVAERDDFFDISHYADELLKSDKVRIDELNKIKSEDTTELDLLKEHHKLLVELIMNFYR